MSSIHEELCVLIIFINRHIEELECLIVISQRVITAALTVKNTRVFMLGVQIEALLKILNSFHITATLQLGDTSSIESFGIPGLYCDGLVEVVNGELMISHVLVDKAACYKNGLILGHLHEHAAEALEGLIKSVEVAVHGAQMEATTNKVLTDGNGLFEHLNSFFLECHILVLGVKLGFGLKSETLCMPELWIFAFLPDCLIKVDMSKVVFAFVKEDISSIEEHQSIIRV